METTIVLTRDPISSAHHTEAVRLALMLSALEHKVNFVLIDDGVYLLLAFCGYTFKNETADALLKSDSVRLIACRSSAEHNIPQFLSKALEVCSMADEKEIAQLLLSTRAVIF
ncbi:MAG: DsrE family protein [Methanomassiliicoccales archaeon]